MGSRGFAAWCDIRWRRFRSVLLELALSLVVSVTVGAQVGLQLLGVAPVGIAECLERVVDLIAQIEVDTRYQNGGVVRKIVHSGKCWIVKVATRGETANKQPSQILQPRIFLTCVNGAQCEKGCR